MRIVYLEGRPSAHILHRRFAQSLTDEIEFIDPKIRWQDRSRGFIFNFFAWVINAYTLSKRYKKTDVFLVDNLHFTPILIKYLFSTKGKKIIAHLGSHTLYFIRNNKFNTLNNMLHKFMIRMYDGFICEGEMAGEILQNIGKGKTPPFAVTFLGPPSERYPRLSKLKPDLHSKNILIIANGPSLFRMYYKGIDIMFSAFELALNKINDLTLTIVGAWDEKSKKILLDNFGIELKDRINFKGSVTNIEDYLTKSGVCLHCTRGDAFPTSTLESMAAGVPTIVSNWTGTKQVVKEVTSKLITGLESQKIADCIVHYYSLSYSQKMKISDDCRKAVMPYTEELAILDYKKKFHELCSKIM
jgi:glycosyltransferase involved in cell wall biosynthesis